MPASVLPPYLSLDHIDDLVRRALAEDVGDGDVTTEATVPPGLEARAAFLAKEPGIVAGLLVAERVFAAVDPEVRVSWSTQDGALVPRGTSFGVVEGRARSLLTAERLSLNLMQRMSGIATATHEMVELIRPHPARLLDTRKTAPGLRLLDKWAVRLGGGENHRIGLFDMILIKDNHIDATGGIREAIRAAQAFRDSSGRDLKIEVEARTLADVEQALEAGVDFVLLDNMVHATPAGRIDTSLLARAVELVDGRLRTEASGNVTRETVHAIAATGVDYISCGALTHSVRAMDISLKIRLA